MTILDPRVYKFMTCVAEDAHISLVDAATGETSCERCGAELPRVTVTELRERPRHEEDRGERYDRPGDRFGEAPRAGVDARAERRPELPAALAATAGAA